MRTFLRTIGLLALAIAVFSCGGSRPEGLVGLWRTDTVTRTAPGRTNAVQAYSTIEFLKDGSFKIADVIKGADGKEMALPTAGTYTLIDTNHVRLEVAPDSARPTEKVPLTVSYSISGDQLELPALVPNVTSETRKYRRVRR